MIIVSYAHGHSCHLEAFGSLVEAQAFINDLVVKGVNFEVKFR